MRVKVCDVVGVFSGREDNVNLGCDMKKYGFFVVSHFFRRSLFYSRVFFLV